MPSATSCTTSRPPLSEELAAVHPGDRLARRFQLATATLSRLRESRVPMARRKIHRSERCTSYWRTRRARSRFIGNSRVTDSASGTFVVQMAMDVLRRADYGKAVRGLKTGNR